MESCNTIRRSGRIQNALENKLKIGEESNVSTGSQNGSAGRRNASQEKPPSTDEDQLKIERVKEGKLTKKPKLTRAKVREKQPCPEYNLPEEVVEHILLMSQDVQLAKACRLVNKLWDRASCRFLREHACIVISQEMDRKRLKLVQKLLNICSERAKDLTDLPSPYRDVHLFLKDLRCKPLLEFIVLHNLNITTLTGPQHYFPLTFPRLSIVLERVESTLTYLHLTFPRVQGIPEDLPKTTFRLHNLKYLDFEISGNRWGWNITDSECQYLKKILQGSAPEHIKLHLTPAGSFTKLLSDVFAWKSNLKTLQLSGTMYEDDLKAIGRMSPSVALKDFTLDWRRREYDLENDDERLHGLVVPFLQKVRCQLNRLEISSYTLLGVNFEFPNLKQLQIVGEMGNAVSYLSQHFPKLETFGFVSNCSDDLEDPINDFCHFNITRLNIDFGSSVYFSAVGLKRFQDALKRLGDQLPNINTLSVQIGKIYAEYGQVNQVLYLLADNFPRIKNLRVGKWFDETLLIGREFCSRSLEYALGMRTMQESPAFGWQFMDSDDESPDDEEFDEDDSDEGWFTLPELEKRRLARAQRRKSAKQKNVFSVGVTNFQDLEVLRWDSAEDHQRGSEHHPIFRLVPRDIDKKLITSTMRKQGLAKLPKLKKLILENCSHFQIQNKTIFHRSLPYLQVITER